MITATAAIATPDAAPTEPRSWRPELLISSIWTPATARFATKAEAEAMADELLLKRMTATAARAWPSMDEPNSRRRPDGRVVRIY